MQWKKKVWVIKDQFSKYVCKYASMVGTQWGSFRLLSPIPHRVSHRDSVQFQSHLKKDFAVVAAVMWTQPHTWVRVLNILWFKPSSQILQLLKKWLLKNACAQLANGLRWTQMRERRGLQLQGVQVILINSTSKRSGHSKSDWAVWPLASHLLCTLQ